MKIAVLIVAIILLLLAAASLAYAQDGLQVHVVPLADHTLEIAWEAPSDTTRWQALRCPLASPCSLIANGGRDTSGTITLYGVQPREHIILTAWQRARFVESVITVPFWAYLPEVRQ